MTWRLASQSLPTWLRLVCRRAPLTAASYRYFLRGQSLPPSADDYRVRAQRRAKLAAFDRLLRKFQYRDALDAALATGKPEVVASVLQELTTRSGLNAALGTSGARLPCAGPALLAEPLSKPAPRQNYGCSDRRRASSSRLCHWLHLSIAVSRLLTAQAVVMRSPWPP